MIQVDTLHKRFGDVIAVDGISFAVEDGEIFGLLGPNGAGKTTTISMISGILKPDQGRVLIDRQDIWVSGKKVKGRLGVVPQEIAVYEDLTARDNLRFWGSLYGLKGARLAAALEEAVTRVGLADRLDSKVKEFSGGMKRRLNLCMGLLHRPKFLLLDEPTVGIDPQARLNILEVIREVAAAGTTVLYTTHYMEEAEDLCDRIAIIDHGKILALGSLSELTALAGKAEVLRISGSFDERTGREALGRIDGTRLLNVGDGSGVLSIEAPGPGLMQVLPRVLALPIELADVSIQRPDLQSVFISLTGRELRD